MSKADKMFEKLGYTLTENEDGDLVYSSTLWSIFIGIGFREYYHHGNIIDDVVAIGLPEHLAIHEKMKELGWLNEK